MISGHTPECRQIPRGAAKRRGARGATSGVRSALSLSLYLTPCNLYLMPCVNVFLSPRPPPSLPPRVRIWNAACPVLSWPCGAQVTDGEGGRQGGLTAALAVLVPRRASRMRSSACSLICVQNPVICLSCACPSSRFEWPSYPCPLVPFQAACTPSLSCLGRYQE